MFSVMCFVPIPYNISEKLKVGVLLGKLVSESFQSTESSCKLYAALHSVCQIQNREYHHIVRWDALWEDEYNIVFGSDILCVVFAKIPRTSFSKKKDDASEGDS